MKSKDSSTTGQELRERVVELVRTAREGISGATSGPLDKQHLRRLHEPARAMELATHEAWLDKRLPKLLPYFADGNEVDPDRVDPQLVQVKDTWQRDLFRAARLTWSLPYTKGFGRRLQFLILDGSNDKLIGLLGLQSPPLSFPPRDRLFKYPSGRKTELVNQTMDIYTLGAVPPYARLLGGKLVALTAATNEVRAAYRHKYRGRRTEMEARYLPARLVALTTTSAFGRSSIYNRLRYNDELIAEPIGYTKGYGTFHLAKLYPVFRDFLDEQGVSTRGGFGTGPRIKWQTIVRALQRLGLDSELLRHGAPRQAFLFRLVRNLESYMAGRWKRPMYRNVAFPDLAAHWRERWLLPRAERVDGWRTWTRGDIEEMLAIADGTHNDAD